MTRRLLQLRRISLEGYSIADTANYIGAAQRALTTTPRLAFKTGFAGALSDSDMFTVAGTLTGLSAAISDAATNGTRIVVLGNDGSTHAKLSYSDNDGVTWTAVTTGLSVQAGKIVYLPAGGTSVSAFISSMVGSVQFSARANDSSLTGQTMVNSGVGFPLGGIAVYFDGTDYHPVICGASGSNPAFQQYHWNGSSWSLTGAPTCGAPTGTFDEAGTVIGNGGTKIYHAGRQGSGSRLQVSISPDGAISWPTFQLISAPVGATFTARPRIIMCQLTGLLVIVAPAGAQDLLYVSVDGINWLGSQQLVPSLGVDAYALAGGRLIATNGAMLLAADGI